MKLESIETIFRALQDAKVRYLVVGGVAVIAHGYVRTTEDLDLVLDLERDSLIQALNALKDLGYRPIAPVSLLDFADPERRKDWKENHNMKVFSLVSDRVPDVTIDIFGENPFVFEVEYAAGVWKEVSPNLKTCVVSLPALIALKKDADRHKDRDDIEKLRKLHPDLES